MSDRAAWPAGFPVPFYGLAKLSKLAEWPPATYGLRHLKPRTANTTTHRAAKPSPIPAPHGTQITPARATPYTAHSVRFHAFCLHHGFTRTR